MADVSAIAGGGSHRGIMAVLFATYLDAAYNVMSATNSSPQTTELFASDRADTLWKYVKLGDYQVIGAGLIGAWIAGPELWVWPLLGAGAAMVAMHLMYRHALQAGMKGGTDNEPVGV